jgi:translation initiation factor 1
MKKNLFEMGAKFEDGWSSDNKSKAKTAKQEIKEPAKHLLTFANEKRRGKTVTIIKPFFLTTDTLKSLLKELKKILGSGGTIKENTLELQGEVNTKAKEFLIKKGFRFK